MNTVYFEWINWLGFLHPGCSDHVVKLWNLDICDFSADLIGHEGPVTSVALAGDEAFAVSGSEDKTVKVWSIMMGCVITDYKVSHVTYL